MEDDAISHMQVDIGKEVQARRKQLQVLAPPLCIALPLSMVMPLCIALPYSPAPGSCAFTLLFTKLTGSTATMFDHVCTCKANSKHIDKALKIGSQLLDFSVLYVWINQNGELFDLSGRSAGSHAQ